MLATLALSAAALTFTLQPPSQTPFQPGAYEETVAALLGHRSFTIQEVQLAPVPDGVSMHIQLGECGAWVELRWCALRTPLFRVLVADGLSNVREVTPPPPSAVRGIVNDPRGGEAVGSLTDAGFAGVVELDGRWNIVPLSRIIPDAPPGMHVVYAMGSESSGDWTCGTVGERVAPRASDGAQQDRSLGARVCEIACDADYEFYTANGSSITNVIADIEGVLNATNVIYEQDAQLTFELGTVIVRVSEPDPYTSTTPSTLLTEFGTEWVNNQQSVARDVAQLFTGKDLAGSTIGISRVAGVCITSSATLGGYSLVQSRFSAEFDRRAALTAHELGHTFSLTGHCDGDWDCRVMCAAMGSCNGYRSFDAISLSAFRWYIPTCACLSPGESDPTTTAFPFVDQFAGSTLSSSRWMAVDGATIGYASMNPPSPPSVAWILAHNTMRTRPMPISVPSRLTVWTETRGTENGDKLLIEYFRTSDGRWVTLAELRADGVSQTAFVKREYDLPIDSIGSYFAVRFTGWAVGADSTDNWYLDDLSIAPIPCPGDINADGFVNGDDYDFFAGFFEAGDLRADFNADGFVNGDDYDAFAEHFEAGC